jgi:hypothetical protein
LKASLKECERLAAHSTCVTTMVEAIEAEGEAEVAGEEGGDAKRSKIEA